MRRQTIASTSFLRASIVSAGATGTARISALGAFLLSASQGGSDAGPRCYAVIDEDHGSALERHSCAPLQIGFAAPLDLLELLFDAGIDIFRRDAGKLGDIFVDHHLRLAAIDDRRNCELALQWHADLAHEHDVERCPKRACDLGCNRNAPTRQGKHHGGSEMPRRQRFCQCAAGSTTVGKWSGELHLLHA